MSDTTGIREAYGLYRVSTRQQEQRGESLDNQQRAVRAWAASHGITIVQEIRVQESAKDALQLVDGAFQFNRRAEYAKLIRDLQKASPATRPQAILIDWIDRWSRNNFEYTGIIKAFRQLGVKMFAVGDEMELTDPQKKLEVQFRSLLSENELDKTSQKVKESRKSRRERGLWQGGSPPDGYRTHLPECRGPVELERETADGSKKKYKQRACPCPKTVLYRDPAREETMKEVWRVLTTSPLSWEGMAAEVNSRGFRRPNGKAWRWDDLYRIGENPHYAGVLATDRDVRDPLTGKRIGRKPLKEQTLTYSPQAIPEPYLSQDTFWGLYEQRFNKDTRRMPRQKGGCSSELIGLLRCPECDSVMTSFYTMSPKKTGHGNPRRSPRKKYRFMRCPVGSGQRPEHFPCSNKQAVHVKAISELLISCVTSITKLDDDAIEEALQIQRRSESSLKSLEKERLEVLRSIESSKNARHVLVSAAARGLITDEELEQELFAFKRDLNEAEQRLRDIDRTLATHHARPDFQHARETLAWLVNKWTDLEVAERAEALRLLIEWATYTPNGTVDVEEIRILKYGPAFVAPPAATNPLVTQKIG